MTTTQSDVLNLLADLADETAVMLQNDDTGRWSEDDVRCLNTLAKHFHDLLLSIADARSVRAARETSGW